MDLKGLIGNGKLDLAKYLAARNPEILVQVKGVYTSLLSAKSSNRHGVDLFTKYTQNNSIFDFLRFLVSHDVKPPSDLFLDSATHGVLFSHFRTHSTPSFWKSRIQFIDLLIECKVLLPLSAILDLIKGNPDAHDLIRFLEVVSSLDLVFKDSLPNRTLRSFLHKRKDIIIDEKVEKIIERIESTLK